MRRALIALWMAASSLPVHAQYPAPAIASVEHAMALGLVVLKSECSGVFPDLRPKLQDAFLLFARRSTGTFSEAQWSRLDQATSEARRPAAVPSRRECEELLSKLGTESFDVAARDFSREFREMTEAFAVASKGRGALGIDIDPESVARVQSVVPGSPAEKAGIRPGDTIVHFDGTPITKPWHLYVAVRSATVGKKVRVTVMRDNVSRDLEAVVGEINE